MAGEDVRFEEVVGGFFAGVQVDGAEEGADEVCGGAFDCGGLVVVALLVFEVEFGAFGVVELSAWDFVAEVVGFDCSGADASAPAAFCVGGFLLGVCFCDWGKFFYLGSCAVDRGVSGFHAIALEETRVDFAARGGGDYNTPIAGFWGEGFGTAVPPFFFGCNAGSTAPPGGAAIPTPHSRVMEARVLGPQ